MTVSYDRAAFEMAHERLRRAPAELSLSDIEQLTAFSVELGREGLAARKAALFPAPASVAAPCPAPAAKSGLSQGSIDAIARGRCHVRRRASEADLTRLHALEQEREKGVGNVRWRGVFKQGDRCQAGELATYGGGLWVCRRDTSQTPGRPPYPDGAADWTLVVKSGEAPR